MHLPSLEPIQNIPNYKLQFQSAHNQRREREKQSVDRYKHRKGMVRAMHMMAPAPVSSHSQRTKRQRFLNSWRKMVLIATRVQITNSTPLNRLVNDICKKHQINRNLFKSQCRTRPIVIARQEYSYKARLLGFSLSAIAKAVGLTHHTTILHADRKYRRLMLIKRGQDHLKQRNDNNIDWDLII